MTIHKKNKGVPFPKKEKKKTHNKEMSKKASIAKDNNYLQKKWQKNIKIEFEDEFLNSSFHLNNILE